MALPSSPPALPDLDLDEEPELPWPSSPPPLPAASSLYLPIALPNRKRPLPDDEINLSSDPLFSEDPSEAEDQTEYDRPKRKRMVKGPWWMHGRRSSQTPVSHARDDFRNADSGVWLGSDESIDSLLSTARDLNVTDRMILRDSTAAQPLSLPQGERVARQIVGDCVETGHEKVDLSALGLAQLSSDVLKPLHQLIRQSHGTLTEPPSEDEFVALTPSIQLFLARNQLTSLPAELFRLENVTVLSLRSNELGEIPHAIARLRNLKELNIAGNHIRCLPWGLMSFLDYEGDENQITVRPNPLVEPTKIEGPSPLSKLTVHTNAEDLSRWGDTREYYEGLRRAFSEHGPLDIRAELELRLKLGRLLRIQYLQEASRAGKEINLRREELIYLASSKVRYFDVDGTAVRIAGPDDKAYRATIEPLDDAARPMSSSYSPSLFELALRSIQKHYSLQDFPGGIPPTVRLAFSTAARGVDFGNQTCSTCGRAFIIPRAEWIEYWHNGSPSQTELKQETVLPFMKRVCSWRCATPTEVGTFKC